MKSPIVVRRRVARVLCAAGVVAGLASVAWYLFQQVQPLRFADAVGVKVDVVGKTVKVRGEVFHSSLAVRMISFDSRDHIVYMSVLLCPVSHDYSSGAFDVTMELPADASEIRLGEPPHWRTVGLIAGRRVRIPCGSTSPESVGTIWKEVK